MKKFLKQISNIQYGEIEIITPDKKKYKRKDKHVKRYT